MSILVLWGRERERERAGCFALSSWCLVIVVWLFLTMPRVCLQFVIVVFPIHTYYFYSADPRVVQLLLFSVKRISFVSQKFKLEATYKVYPKIFENVFLIVFFTFLLNVLYLAQQSPMVCRLHGNF